MTASPFDDPARSLMDEDEWINDTARAAGFPCGCGHHPGIHTPGCAECPCPVYEVGPE